MPTSEAVAREDAVSYFYRESVTVPYRRTGVVTEGASGNQRTSDREPASGHEYRVIPVAAEPAVDESWRSQVRLDGATPLGSVVLKDAIQVQGRAGRVVCRPPSVTC